MSRYPGGKGRGEERWGAAAASGEHIKALVRSHAAGDDAGFYAVALQVAAKAARQGHSSLAGDLKQTIEAARRQPVADKVTAIARPRGDLADLVTAEFPDVTLRDLIGPLKFKEAVGRVLHEQRQRQALLDHGYTGAPIVVGGPAGHR